MFGITSHICSTQSLKNLTRIALNAYKTFSSGLPAPPLTKNDRNSSGKVAWHWIVLIAKLTARTNFSGMATKRGPPTAMTVTIEFVFLFAVPSSNSQAL